MWIRTRSGVLQWSSQRSSTRTHSNNPLAPEPYRSESVPGPRWGAFTEWIIQKQTRHLTPTVHHSWSYLIPIQSQKLPPENCKAILQRHIGVCPELGQFRSIG